jgi:hypothetical protein
MKKLFKWVLVFVAVLIIGGMVAGGGEEEVTPTEPTEVSAQPEKEAEPKKAEPKKEEKKDFKAAYEKIVQGDALSGEGGMSYEEVVALLGEPDTKTESKSGDMTLLMTGWTDLSMDGFGMISVTFTNGKVSGKSLTE